MASAPATGVFQFSPSTTADTTGVGGLAVASFFLGDISSGSVAAPLDLGYKKSYHALFVQDDWKITPTLTINAGLRWDIAVPYAERFGQLASPLRNSDPYGVYFNWDTPFPQAVLGTIPNTDPAFRNGQGVAYMSPSEIGRPAVDYMISAGFQRELPGHVLLDTSFFSNLRRHDSDITQLDALAPQYRSLGPLLNMPLNSPQVQALGYKAPFPI